MKKPFLIILFFLIATTAYARAIYPFNNQQQQLTFTQLTQQLRCLVCQNENLASSNASLAIDLKRQIYQMVKAGKTKQDIIHYMVARYGDFILFNPPVVRRTYLLWYAPLILLLAGMFILGFVIWRRSKMDDA